MANDVEGTASAPLRADNVISQKIQHILSTSYTDASIRTALLTLDDRMDDNTVESRRDLRSNTEAEVIKNNGAILRDFSKLATKLQSLGDTIDQLNKTHNSMNQLVDHAQRSTSQLVRESKDLKAQDDKVVGKQLLLDAFQSTFVVNEQEVEILTGAETPIDDQFFRSLDKCKRVIDDCSALLSTENAQSGEKVMETMTGHMEKAYDKLFRSIKADFRGLTGQYMQIGALLRKKLNVLAERPNLFESAFEGLRETRQHNLSQEFVRALTSQNENNSKPIDFYAYDSLRYMGDMLAWIHSAVVNERENLDGLFGTEMTDGLKHGQEMEPWSNKIDFNQLIETQVDKITETLIKPLRTRVEQVLAAEPKAVSIYQAYHVLGFYQSVFEKHIPSESQIGQAIMRLQESCMRRMSVRLEDRLADAKQHPIESLQVEDLQPPDYLAQAIQDLKYCMDSYYKSINYSSSGDDNIKKVINDLVEPYLELCRRAASDNMSNMLNEQIFLINCFDHVKMNLSLYPFASYKVDHLEHEITEISGALEERLFGQFMKSSGLAKLESYSKDEVVELGVTLDEWLPTATLESNEMLYKLNPPHIAASISGNAVNRFIKEFEAVEAKIQEQDDLAQVFPRSTDEVRAVLDIDR